MTDDLQPTCTLDLTEPTGADTFGVIDLSGLEAICKLKPGSRADTGDKVELHFEVGAACVFDPASGDRLDS